MNEDIYNLIKEIFSEDGATNGFTNVKVDGELLSKIYVKDGVIHIDFIEEKPKLSLKIINADLSGITLGKKGGVLEIDNFPDIPFKYRWLEK